MFKSLLAKLAVRQMTALKAIPLVLKKLPLLFFTGKIKGFFASILAVFQLLGVIIYDNPGPIIGDEIDLSNYSIVFCDEFNGDSLDKDVWQTCPMLGTGEIFDESMMSFDGNNMIISTKYLEDGSKGPGWYTYGIENTDDYSNFKPGCYYECRCKAPAAKGMWSAFWMMTKGQKDRLNGPDTGYTEIDVMESFNYGKDFANSTLHTLHKWLPEEGRFQSEIVGKYRVDKDIYNEYVTYGVLWEENEFVFYIDGRETGRSTNGATTDPAFMLLTCQVKLDGQEHPEVLDNPESAFPADFVVDYVRVYGRNK